MEEDDLLRRELEEHDLRRQLQWVLAEALGLRMAVASGEGMMAEVSSKGAESALRATGHTTLGGMISEEANLSKEAAVMGVRGLGIITIREIGGQISGQLGTA